MDWYIRASVIASNHFGYHCKDPTLLPYPTAATLLNEICIDVQIQPQLQSLAGEYFDAKTANRHEDTPLDISARGFWFSGQKALFGIRVFNPIASRYRNTPQQMLHHKWKRKEKAV